MTAEILSRLPLLAKWSGRMIQIKTAHEIELMRASGLVTAGAIRAVKAAVRPGVSTKELDAVAEDFIRSKGAVPNFLGYHGFTGTICASVNDEIVHGIPNPERRLAAGDNISIDCGAILEGWHSDSAVTSPEARISSSSRAVLIWIMRPLHFASSGTLASSASRRPPCTAGRPQAPVGVVLVSGSSGSTPRARSARAVTSSTEPIASIRDSSPTPS